MNVEKKLWLKRKPHHHTVLNKIRSTISHELYNKPEEICDSDGVKLLKSRFDENKTVDNAIRLSEAYNSQLRYRDSISLLEPFYNEDSNNYNVKRRLAMLYMKTGNKDKAIEFFESLEDIADDKLDVLYRIGLSNFYGGNFIKSKAYFEKALAYTKDNDEMYIACIYWLLCSIVELKEKVDEVINSFESKYVPHHAGYEYAINLFLGDEPSLYEEISNSDNLTRSMYLFGKYEFYKYIGDMDNVKKTYQEGLKCDEFWAGFAGLGFWYKELYFTESNI